MTSLPDNLIDLDTVRRACFDPGAFVPREVTDHGDEYPGIEYEPLHSWQARAVVFALSDKDGP